MALGKPDGSVLVNTVMDTSGITKGISAIKGGVQGIGSAVGKLGMLVAGAFSIKALVEFSKQCIEVGSDLEEVQNVVNVTFGAMSDEIDAFAKQAATSLGLSELAAKQYTSTLGAMFKSMGYTESQAADMSMQMTALAADMASFYNLDADTAFQKIRSGISGETEPLKQLGINLSAANLEQYRLAQGITTAYSAMNQQQQAMLRYNYLLSVTSDAQGDFARTSDSWANQLKVLKLQFESIKADLGAGFIAVLTPVLQMLNKLLQAIARVASSFKAFTEMITGKKSGESKGISQALADSADSTNSLASATKNATKATKAAEKENRKYLSGLDEIRTYTEDIANSSSDGGTAGKNAAASGGSAGTALTPYEFGELKTGETVVDKLAQKMKSLYDTIVKGSQPVINALKNLWDNGLKQMGDFTGKALVDFYEMFLKPIGSWAMGEGIPRFINAFNNGLMSVDWEKLRNSLRGLWEQLAPFAQKVGEGFIWFYENALVPLKTWVANEVLPRFLDNVAALLRVLNSVIEALKPYFTWFWDKVLVPIAEWTGGLFLSILDKTNEALTVLGDWCKENPDIIAAAWEMIKQKAVAIWTQIRLWFIEVWNKIKEKCDNAWNAMKDSVILGWESIKQKAIALWTQIRLWFIEVWNDIKLKAEGVWNAVKDTVILGWETVKTKATTLWNDVRLFLIKMWNKIKDKAVSTWELIRDTVVGVWDSVKSKAVNIWTTLYNWFVAKWGAIKRKAIEIYEGIRDTIAGVWDSVKTTAEDLWKAIKDTIVGYFDKIYNDAFGEEGWITKLSGDLEGIWVTISQAASKGWSVIKQTILFWIDKLHDYLFGEEGLFPGWDVTLSGIWETIKSTANTAWGGIKKTIGDWVDGIFEKVQTVASDITSAFSGAFWAIGGFITAPINGIIDSINLMIEACVKGINGLIDGLNWFSFDLPSWMGGWHLGFDIPRITSYPQIKHIGNIFSYLPWFAKGAVIPPNAPFLGVLGDQKNGTNIETPEGLLRQIIREEGGGDIQVTLNLDGQVVWKTVLNRARQQQMYSGVNPFELA